MIGKKLRGIRNDKGFSLRKLAKATGLSHGFICDIEHERCNPSIETLKILANTLGVRPEFFLNDMVGSDDHMKLNSAKA